MRVWPFGRPDDTARAVDLLVRRQASVEASPAELYALLRRFYASNGLYREMARRFYEWGIAAPATRALRNPTFRTVEAYVAHVWGGPVDEVFALRGDNAARLQPVVDLVLEWSQWTTRKQVAVRALARDGDLFAKVVQPPDRRRVYIEILDAAQVTDFATDDRGFVTTLRLDVPQTERRGRVAVGRMLTEVWSKDDQRMRRWVHDAPAEAPVEELGTPTVDLPFAALGIDFVPIVHTPFRDVGEVRGQAAVWPVLERITEADQKATRLAQLLFRHNRPTNVVTAQGTDATGRPVPALRVKRGTTGPAVADDPSAGELLIGDESFLSLPGGYELRPVVAPLDYGSHLAALAADVAEIEQNLPVLVLARASEVGSGDLSGRAIRFAMTSAIASIREVRANADAAALRLLHIALTLGANAGLWDVGRYEAGDYAASFVPRDVVPLSGLETAQIAQTDAQTLLALTQAGIDVGTAGEIVYGWDHVRTAEVLRRREVAAAEAGDRMMAAFDRGAV